MMIVSVWQRRRGGPASTTGTADQSEGNESHIEVCDDAVTNFRITRSRWAVELMNHKILGW